MNAPRLVLTMGGLGLLRPAPGTWGSLPPVVLAWMLAMVVDPSQRWTADVCIALLGLAGAIGCIRFGEQGEELFGRKDPPQVVADETAGQAIPLLLLPWDLGGAALGWNALLAGIAFASFRLFDILKPPPAGVIQRCKGGWGILADDLAAGIYALIVTQAVVRMAL